MRAPVTLLALLVATSSTAGELDTNRDAVVLELKAGQHQLPDGFFFTRKAFEVTNSEMVRLQNQETRLKAENDELKKQSSLAPIISTTILAIVTGVSVWVSLSSHGK